MEDVRIIRRTSILRGAAYHEYWDGMQWRKLWECEPALFSEDVASALALRLRRPILNQFIEIIDRDKYVLMMHPDRTEKLKRIGWVVYADNVSLYYSKDHRMESGIGRAMIFNNSLDARDVCKAMDIVYRKWNRKHSIKEYIYYA